MAKVQSPLAHTEKYDRKKVGREMGRGFPVY
jgi:hypothetical protein